MIDWGTCYTVASRMMQLDGDIEAFGNVTMIIRN